jgi:hypothetical protein
MGEKDLNKFMKLEKQLDNLIKNPSGTSRELMKKKDAIRSKMKKLEPGVRGMEDGGLMEAIGKVRAKGMEDGGDVPKPKMRPKKDPFRADKTESLDKKFSKKVSRINKKNMENVKGNLNKLKGTKESLEDNEDIFKKKAKKMEGGGLIGGQKKLDKNKDGRISGEDFKLLRAKPMKLGGVVKMGSGGGVCKGMGAARAGGKFKIR